jgi:hypothetical protein
VEIANVEAALENVRSFIAVLQQSEGIWESSGEMNPLWKQFESQIHQELPLVALIAARADPELAVKLKEGSYGWPHHRTMEAARQLAGLLDSIEAAKQILGSVGPNLAAANLHPWIWNAAVDLWDDGHLKEAVQAATLAPSAPGAVKMSQSPGRNAAHCLGRPLHPQGHPKILSNRTAKTAPQKASSGPALARGASAVPAGLTARARPEARPEARAANLS